MKKSSYLIILLVIAAIGLSAILPIIIVDKKQDLKTGVPISTAIDGDSSPIREIAITTKDSGLIFTDLFKRLEIAVSDSIPAPIVTVDSAFCQFITPVLSGGQLQLQISSNGKTITMISVRKRAVIQLSLPVSCIFDITSPFEQLAINGLDTHALRISGGRKLLMDNCNVNDISIFADADIKIKLSECHLNHASINMGGHSARISCDSTSLIHYLNFINQSDSKTELNLYEANVDTARWVQNGSGKLTLRLKNPITIIK